MNGSQPAILGQEERHRGAQRGTAGGLEVQQLLIVRVQKSHRLNAAGD